MKKTKFVAVAVATLMAVTTVGALAGCGGNSATTINVMLLANANEEVFYRKYFQEMEETIREETGIDYTIKFNGQQEENYYNTLGAAIQGGQTPDIFYLRPNELMAYKTEIASLEDFAKTQDYADLSAIYENALDMYRFNPETGAIGNKEDELYAFPKDLSTQQLGYNKKLLSKYEQAIKAAGLKMPWEMDFSKENYSWEKFKTLCKTVADAIVANKDSNVYPCDVPPIEILAKSYGSDLIDMTGGRANAKIITPASGKLNEAIKFQADFIACGAGDYENATYANFAAGRVCFYGAVGSWEIAEYNKLLNKDDNGQPTEEECWGVMPWPTTDGGTDWQGLITSAGYVVSKACANSEKGDVAKRIAVSFLSSATQDRLVRVEKISLPLRPSIVNDYISEEQDNVYSPSTREYFVDVISGEHGFFPAEYKTYDDLWLGELDDALVDIWNAKGNAVTQFNNTNWETVATRMQQQYDASKNN